LLQHHQVLHRGLPRVDPHHGQRHHPAEGARGGRLLRPGPARVALDHGARRAGVRAPRRHPPDGRRTDVSSSWPLTSARPWQAPRRPARRRRAPAPGHGVLAGRRVGMAPADTGVAVFEERLRQAVTRVPSLPDLAARLTHAVTVAIDRTKTADANGHGLPLVSRLRIATFFALACGVIFLPVEGSGVSRDTSFSLLVLYAWHAVLTTFVLIASLTARGDRNAGRLAVLPARLAERQRAPSALSTRALSLQEEERRRLSPELHDEFGQSLTAVNANLWLIEREAPADAEALRHRAAETRRLVGRTLAAM